MSEIPLLRCSECKALVTLPAEKCPNCGYVFPHLERDPKRRDEIDVKNLKQDQDPSQSLIIQQSVEKPKQETSLRDQLHTQESYRAPLKKYKRDARRRRLGNFVEEWFSSCVGWGITFAALLGLALWLEPYNTTLSLIVFFGPLTAVGLWFLYVTIIDPIVYEATKSAEQKQIDRIRRGTGKQYYPSNYPDNWDKIRAQVKRRDGYECGNCGSKSNLHVHHIVPLSKGGSNNLSNLRTLCEDCHKKIHPHMRK